MCTPGRKVEKALLRIRAWTQSESSTTAARARVVANPSASATAAAGSSAAARGSDNRHGYEHGGGKKRLFVDLGSGDGEAVLQAAALGTSRFRRCTAVYQCMYVALLLLQGVITHTYTNGWIEVYIPICIYRMCVCVCVWKYTLLISHNPAIPRTYHNEHTPTFSFRFQVTNALE